MQVRQMSFVTVYAAHCAFASYKRLTSQRDVVLSVMNLFGLIYLVLPHMHVFASTLLLPVSGLLLHSYRHYLAITTVKRSLFGYWFGNWVTRVGYFHVISVLFPPYFPTIWTVIESAAGLSSCKRGKYSLFLNMFQSCK